MGRGRGGELPPNGGLPPAPGKPALSVVAAEFVPRSASSASLGGLAPEAAPAAAPAPVPGQFDEPVETES